MSHPMSIRRRAERRAAPKPARASGRRPMYSSSEGLS